MTLDYIIFGSYVITMYTLRSRPLSASLAPGSSPLAMRMRFADNIQRIAKLTRQARPLCPAS